MTGNNNRGRQSSNNQQQRRAQAPQGSPQGATPQPALADLLAALAAATGRRDAAHAEMNSLGEQIAQTTGLQVTPSSAATTGPTQADTDAAADALRAAGFAVEAPATPAARTTAGTPAQPQAEPSDELMQLPPLGKRFGTKLRERHDLIVAIIGGLLAAIFCASWIGGGRLGWIVGVAAFVVGGAIIWQVYTRWIYPMIFGRTYRRERTSYVRQITEETR